VTRLGQGLRQIFHLFVLFDKDGEDFSLDGYKAVYGFKILKKKKRRRSCGDRRDGSREVGLELGYPQPTVIRKLSVVVILLGNGHD
jgi:hypothetical protein